MIGVGKSSTHAKNVPILINIPPTGMKHRSVGALVSFTPLRPLKQQSVLEWKKEATHFILLYFIQMNHWSCIPSFPTMRRHGNHLKYLCTCVFVYVWSTLKIGTNLDQLKNTKAGLTTHKDCSHVFYSQGGAQTSRLAVYMQCNLHWKKKQGAEFGWEPGWRSMGGLVDGYVHYVFGLIQHCCVRRVIVCDCGHCHNVSFYCHSVCFLSSTSMDSRITYWL